MSCCCTNIYKICPKVGTCTGAQLWLKYGTAAPAGDYTFQMDFLSGAINKAVTVAGDGIVKLPTNDLNEGYTYIGKLYDADGVTVQLVWDEVSYDCIYFATGLVSGSPINFDNDSFPYSMPINL